MSSRRRAGLSEGKGAVPVDLCLKTLLAHRHFDDIHLAAQNGGQTPFKLAQAAEIIETRRRKFSLSCTATSTSCGIFPACDRAEQGYAQHASRAKLVFMRLQGA